MDSHRYFFLTGRSDFSEWSKAVDVDKEDISKDHHFGQRFQAMIAARRKILETESYRIIETANESQLRTGAKDVFAMGDSVARWIPSEKKWSGGYRFLCDIGRNFIIEIGSKLHKVHRQFIRASNQELYREADSSSDTKELFPPGHEASSSSKQCHDSTSTDEPPLAGTPHKKYSLRSMKSKTPNIEQGGHF